MNEITVLREAAARVLTTAPVWPHGEPDDGMFNVRAKIWADALNVAAAWLRIDVGLIGTIRNVHAEHADDLCWMPADINRIFVAAGLPPQDLHVGDKQAMRRNCDRYIDCLESGGKWRSYAELEAALHAAKAHPDYSYVVTPHGGVAQGWMPSEWDRNHEAEVAGSGDECWRRRKEAP